MSGNSSATNHADVMHWFPKYGKSMAAFRAEVKEGLAAARMSATVTATAPKKYYRVQVGAYSVRAAGFTDAFVKYSE